MLDVVNCCEVKEMKLGFFYKPNLGLDVAISSVLQSRRNAPKLYKMHTIP